MTGEPQVPLILDACVVINLWASRRTTEILNASGFRPVVAGAVAREAMWIKDEHGQYERIPHDDLAADGRIDVWNPVDDELLTMLSLAASLGDGEAASLALGRGRSSPVATDDRPARNAARSLVPPVALTSTSELLRGWSRERPAADVAAALKRIEVGAQFRPPRQDPNAAWWHGARDS